MTSHIWRGSWYAGYGLPNCGRPTGSDDARRIGPCWMRCGRARSRRQSPSRQRWRLRIVHVARLPRQSATWTPSAAGWMTMPPWQAIGLPRRQRAGRASRGHRDQLAPQRSWDGLGQRGRRAALRAIQPGPVGAGGRSAHRLISNLESGPARIRYIAATGSQRASRWGSSRATG